MAVELGQVEGAVDMEPSANVGEQREVSGDREIRVRPADAAVVDAHVAALQKDVERCADAQRRCVSETGDAGAERDLARKRPSAPAAQARRELRKIKRQ